MKKIFLLVLVLFSAPVFCMEPDDEDVTTPMTQGGGTFRGQQPFLIRWAQSGVQEESDPENNPNNAYNHYTYSVNFVSKVPPKDRSFTERVANAWNGGVDQIIAQIPMLIVSVLINEMTNGFPACSKISSILSKKSYENDEADLLTPQFETIQNTDVTIKLLKQLISNLEDVMDSDNPEHQTKLEELKRCKQEHVNALFDESLKFTKLMEQSKSASATA